MATRRSKRKHVDSEHNEATRTKTSHTYEAASDQDRKDWGGWCEIESEPAFFNVMLREWGVKGVKIQEVVSLDQDILQQLPRPIYGIIFLFRWREARESDTKDVDDDIWFANQTADNACATIALLNILNNEDSIELGDQLSQFKLFSASLSPAMRGNALSQFDFVRQTHNSFARKMDMLNSDLTMKNNLAASINGKPRRGSERGESALHFSAFVPVKGQLWRLDGLETQPTCLGPILNEWIENVRVNLEAHMTEGDDQNFVILGLVQDPSVELKSHLAINIQSLNSVEARLEAIEKHGSVPNGWSKQEGLADDMPSSASRGPVDDFDLTQADIDRAQVPDTHWARVEEPSLENLLAYWKEIIRTQEQIRHALVHEQLMQRLDEEAVASRRHDYGPAIQKWLQCLNKTGLEALSRDDHVNE